MNKLVEEKLTNYRKRLLEGNVHIYQHTHEEDILLLKWWMTLVETGELNSLIIPEARRLARFLDIFQGNTRTIYSLDDHDRIDFIMWFTEASLASGTLACGMWSHSSIRGTKRQVRVACLIYEIAFEFADNLIGHTWQKDILNQHIKIGYNIVGAFENFHGQPQVYMVQLKKEDFYSSRLYKLGGAL